MRRQSLAFSAVEMLMVIAAVAVTTGLGAVAVVGAHTAAANVKVESDARVLNQALQAYEMGGGSLDQAETPGQVLRKLQTVTTAEDGNNKQIMFLNGAMSDQRLKPTDSGSKLARLLGASPQHIRYNSSIRRFELTDTAGPDTFEGFETDAVRGVKEQVSERRKRTWSQAKIDPWVWDFDPSAVMMPSKPPAEMSVTPVTTPPLPAPGVIPKASPPAVSPAPPQSALLSYPLEVTLNNPNPPAVTRILYQLLPTAGPEQHYSNPFPVDPATTVRAWVQTLDESAISSSDAVTFNFTPDPVEIELSDTFQPTYTYFELGGPRAPGSPAAPPPTAPGVLMSNAASVPLTYQNSAFFRLFHTTDLSDPVASPTHISGIDFSNGYPGDLIPLSPAAFEAGGQVVVRYAAVSTNTNIVRSSLTTSRGISPQPLTLRPPLVTPPGGVSPGTIRVELNLDLSAGDIPEGTRVFYRTDAVDPGDVNGEPEYEATLYTGPFELVPAAGQTTTIVARAYPPTHAKRWFETSPSTSTSYTGHGPPLTFYGVDRTRTIYSVDPLTGTTSVVTNSAPYNLESVAFDAPNSLLYYLESAGSTSRLGRFNLQTNTHADLGRLVGRTGFAYYINSLPSNLECWKGDLYCLPTGTNDLVKIAVGTSGITDIRKAATFSGNGNATAYGSAMGYDGTFYFTTGSALRKFHLPTLSSFQTIRTLLPQFNSLLFHPEQGKLFGTGWLSLTRIDTLATSDGSVGLGPITNPITIGFTGLAEPSGTKPASVPVPAGVYACTGGNREIYRVNPLDGTHALHDSAAPFNVSALAYDDVEGVIYYLEQAAPTDPWRLGKLNFAGSHTILGSIKSGWSYNPAMRPDNLVAYAGSLYYITPGTDDLVRLEVTTGATTIAKQTKVAAIANGSKTFSNPGDLVVDADGMIFWVNRDASGTRFHRYSLTQPGGAYADIGPTAAEYPALGFDQGSLYGARASTTNIERIVINTGNPEAPVATNPAKTFVDFGSPVPAEFAQPSDSLWAIREVGGRARLVQFVNYRNSSNNVHAVDWGEIAHEDGSTSKSFSASGSSTGIAGMALTDDGIAYFVNNRPVTAGGITYARPLMSLSIIGFLKGDPLVARVVGDLKVQIQNVLGTTLGSADRITGLAISPEDDQLYVVLNRTTGAARDHLLRIDTFTTDGGEQIGAAVDVGVLRTGGSQGSDETEDMAFDRNGVLYITDTKDDEIYVVNPATAAITSTFSTQGNGHYTGLAIHPFDGELVASSTDDSLLDQMMHATAGSGNDPLYFNYRTRFAYSGIQAIAFYTYPRDIVDPEVDPDAGLAGGHMDVDTCSRLHEMGRGATDGHVHQYDKKYRVTGLDCFNFHSNGLRNINYEIVSGWTKFKILVANPNLSPGGRIVINRDYNPDDPTTYIPVKTYAETPVSSLPIYSFDGVPGTVRLEKLGMYFPADSVLVGGLHSTTTGGVRSNKAGKYGEWRNGALTIHAVLINPDGTPGFTNDLTLSNGGKQGVARSGLLWECTMFNHHHGPSYDRQ